MKDYLESLEIGEGKVKLSKEEIKLILTEHGKTVTTETTKVKDDMKTEIDTYKTNIANLEKQIKELPDSKELDTLKTELQKMKDAEQERITNEESKKEDEILTNNIKSVFGDKKFVNSYTENSLVNEIKTALKDKANIGKSAKDLFEELTKDKEGIFTNPNQPKDMPGVNQNISTNVTKEAFEKMGYRERVTLKQENPELYQSFIK